MEFNKFEREIAGLCICTEAIDEIVNQGLLEVKGSSSSDGKTIYFHTQIHQELFLIRLLDFVKEAGDARLTGIKGSCLQILQTISDQSCSNENDNIKELKSYVSALVGFINQQITIKLWLSNIDLDATINVHRIDLLTISGNHCKHNLSRLTGISKKIESILETNGYTIEPQKIPLALENFRDHLQDDYFIYYGSFLSEILNNIRWSIQNYLNPVFYKAYKQKENGLYSYEYPLQIETDISKEWFWRLMNNIRKGPNLKPFKVHNSLKNRSHLEDTNG